MTIALEEFAANLSALSINTNEQIALAVSGGADSLCMTLMMHKLDLKIVCVIVDHGLRAESCDEAIKTREFLSEHNINAIILNWHQYAQNRVIRNLQHEARLARYQLLTRYCQSQNINYLAIAHTKCDQAENVMIRISRGTGIDGLAQIEAKSVVNGITIIRPMLNYQRTEIEEALLTNHWSWINDPSNHNSKFTRVKVRQLLKSSAEHNLELEQKLCLLASNASRASSYLKEQARNHFNEVCFQDHLGTLTIDTLVFAKLHQEMKLRLISMALKYVSHSYYSPKLKSLMLLLNNIDKMEQWKDTTLSGCEILKISAHKLLLLREKSCLRSTQLNAFQKSLLWDHRILIYTEQEIPCDILIKALDEKEWNFIKKQSNFNSTIVPHHKIRMTLPVLLDQSQTTVSCPMLGWSKEGYKIRAKLQKPGADCS